jgi:drug/metabolite transporter (DMT)-like permease
VLLGWLFASEPLTARVVLASVAILGAIVLIRKGEGVSERQAIGSAAREVKSFEQCA